MNLRVLARIGCATLFLPSLALCAETIATARIEQRLSAKQLESIGRRVWQNECGGTREGLTSWNAGENFASLGIGHFIWYPRGVDGPFEESFPKLVRFLASQGVALPAWLKPDSDCPWATRAEFLADAKNARMTELRDLLASTIRQQSVFLVIRLNDSVGKMTNEAPAAARVRIAEQFERMAASSAGLYAMIDYVNFKGEGTKSSERYKGEGWGLLQVLSEMRGSGAGAPKEFAAAAAEVLARRVRNAPPERGEARWLPGWKNRVRAYAEG